MASLAALTPWAVGKRITAAALNLAQTEIGKLQALAYLDSFSGTRSAIVHTTAVSANYGAFSTSGTWTTDAAGIKVPAAGVYLVIAYVTKTAGSWNTRAYLALKTGSTEIARTNIDAGVGETVQSVMGVTGSLAAAAVITPEMYQSSGANVTSTCKLTIVRLPVDV